LLEYEDVFLHLLQHICICTKRYIFFA